MTQPRKPIQEWRLSITASSEISRFGGLGRRPWVIRVRIWNRYSFLSVSLRKIRGLQSRLSRPDNQVTFFREFMRTAWLFLPVLLVIPACGGGGSSTAPMPTLVPTVQPSPTATPAPTPTPTPTPTSTPTPIPTEVPLPNFAAQNLSDIAAPLLKGRSWTQVKIPGLRDQVLNAHLNGVNAVWKNVSPGYANVIYDLRVDRGVITLILDLGGVIQSRDGGQTWSQLSYSFPGNGNYMGYFSCDVSPADTGLILAAGRNLSCSRDGGKTWSEVYASNLPPFMISPAYGTVTGYGAYYGRVRFNADGSRVFACLGALGHDLKQRWGAEDDMATRFSTKSVYVGDGQLQSFQAIGLGSFAGIRVIQPHPTNPDLVYFAFGNGDFYVTRNARSATPTFQALTLPAGYQAVEMDCSPWVEGDLLLTLKPLAGGAGKVMRAHDDGQSLTCTEVPLVDAKGVAFTFDEVRTAKWNPGLKDQVFVGIENRDHLLVSDDGMKSFHALAVPAALSHGETGFYLDAQQVAFDRHSSLAATWSWIGGWTSTDAFKTWSDLLMQYDDARQLWGNKGVGFAECAVDVFLRPSAAYLSTNDHGLFRSTGVHAQWRRISKNPGMPLNGTSPWASLFYPMGVSPDERCILAFARAAYPNDPYSNASFKLVRSSDKGETWTDVSSALGLGNPFAMTSTPRKILFNGDASWQWILAEQTLFYSKDGGTSFKVAIPPFTGGAGLCEAAWDEGHQLLYLSSNSGLARSTDGGATWTKLSDTFTPGLGVTGSGDLVLGLFGKLAVVPFDQIDAVAAQSGFTDYGINQAYVKATVGDTVLEATSSQNGFQRIQCHGNLVLAAVRYGDNWGNRTCGMGPLLSRDGGKTFQWAMYNLPTTQVFCSSLSDTEILLGCAGGAYRWDLSQPLAP